MASQDTFKRMISPTTAVVVMVVLFIVQLLVIGLSYKHGIDFECRANWPTSACAGASSVLVSIYGILGSLALFAMLFPRALSELFAEAGQSLRPLALNAAGLAIALLPLFWLRDGTGQTYLPVTLAFWSVGMGALALGAALFVAPFTRWIAFLRGNASKVVPLMVGGMLAPLLAVLIRPLWRLDWIAGITFDAVVGIIKLLGYDVEIYTEQRIIGAEGFYIDIAPVCSGIEGIALVTIFVSLYLYLFKSELRFPRAFLLFPVGIATSAFLNIVRIVVLLAIGLEGNAELAVGGFHSHAGWMMFTVISIGIVALANSVSWLQKAGAEQTITHVASEPLPPFFKDPMVAKLLPFAVFMLSAIFAQAFSQTPGVVYPLRAAAIAAALLMFWPFLRQLNWRIDPVAVALGIAIGVMWVVVPVADPDTTPPFGSLSGTVLLGWFIVRGIGTIILIPVVEELFFRDYLETKLRRHETLIWSVVAALVTAALFALLHARWVEAFVAGLVFSFVARRSGNITDAILSHATANAVVYTAALLLGRLYII